MKQTLSMIYRLGFILFFIWASLENASFSIQGLAVSFSDFAVLTDTVCFFGITAAFAGSVSGHASEILLRIKAACTALALFLLTLNCSIWFLPLSSGWVLKVLLPALVFFDWIIFDKKGVFKLYDPLLWLLGIALLYCLWACIGKHLFDFYFLFDFFGGKDKLITAVLYTLAAGALMYFFDHLFSGKGSVKLWDLFSFFYRIVFSCLEAYALSETCDRDLLSFVFGLKKFDMLFNFLSFICIALVLIVCFVRNRSFHASAPFPRVKGAFTASAAVILIGYRFLLKSKFSFNDPVAAILHCAAPIMMIFDWILFDSKGKFKPSDPIFWSAAPVLYGMVLLVGGTLTVIYPSISSIRLDALITFGIIGTLMCGYAIYLLDLCFKKRS